MGEPKKKPRTDPSDPDRSRFARFAKELVNVPKKEIDEKAKEWESRADRPPSRKGSKTEQ